MPGLPPSVEISTPATRPPVSAAVPVMVTPWFCGKLAPLAGDVIVAVGGVTSVEGSPGLKGGTRVPAAIPISPKRFNIACFTLGSTESGNCRLIEKGRSANHAKAKRKLPLRERPITVL